MNRERISLTVELLLLMLWVPCILLAFIGLDEPVEWVYRKTQQIREWERGR